MHFRLASSARHTSHTILFESDSDDELPGQVAPASSPSHEGDWLHPDLVEHNHMLQMAEQPVSAGHPPGVLTASSDGEGYVWVPDVPCSSHQGGAANPGVAEQVANAPLAVEHAGDESDALRRNQSSAAPMYAAEAQEGPMCHVPTLAESQNTSLGVEGAASLALIKEEPSDDEGIEDGTAPLPKKQRKAAPRSLHGTKHRTIFGGKELLDGMHSSVSHQAG